MPAERAQEKFAICELRFIPQVTIESSTEQKLFLADRITKLFAKSQMPGTSAETIGVCHL